jgi:hypothetical protein
MMAGSWRDPVAVKVRKNRMNQDLASLSEGENVE